ncbi:hypothetical protein NFI96_029550 [Prochilodus magdalenae]|nr:hypothetical protein NFI96_029550 [Prochilodus magdalenae]
MDETGYSQRDPTARPRVRRDAQFHTLISSITRHPFFEALTVFITILDMAVIALTVEYINPGMYRVPEKVFMFLYALEFSLKVYAEPRGFWKSGLNVLSTALLLVSLVAVFIEGATSFLNFSPVYALRAVKIIIYIPSVLVVVITMLRAIKRTVFMGVFLFFFMFIFAVAGVLYMDYASVEDWGDLGVSLVSTLSIVTVDGWLDLWKNTERVGVAYSLTFFIVFILIGHFIVFNITSGLVILEVERKKETSKQERLKEAALSFKKLVTDRLKKRTLEQLIGSHVSPMKNWQATKMQMGENFPQTVQQLRRSLCSLDNITTDKMSCSLIFMKMYVATAKQQKDNMNK